MIRTLYSILLLVFTPFIILRLYWRSLKAPDYRQRISERFGFYANNKFIQNGICLHAVSVGELMAARPLITHIQKIYPDLPLTITTTTPTASKQVNIIFGGSVQHVYLPYDLPGAVKRFLKAFKPRLFVIMETEIWPNLFYTLNTNHTPLVMANARLAEKSLRGYQKFKFFFAGVLHNVTCIATQSEMDATHFKQLDVSPSQLMVMGNLKYDVSVPQDQVTKAKAVRATFPQKKVWIASSTHPQEEDLILNTAIKIKQQAPNTLCIIAPRHPERFDALAANAVARNLNIARHSQGQSVQQDTDILLADTLGELFYFYALSDVAVVCGSFANIGGHNILEPASLGMPIIVGPQMFHFKTILAEFLRFDAIVQIDDSEDLSPVLLGLLNDPLRSEQMGLRAQDIVLANQGAVLKIFQVLQPFIDLN
ncbi:MAG: lipid IV(A) 3-deoxy-D-manno-octulosonic acid transferase [Gammaproteobacteria bacterium]|jgi:3-deoxy-D-manno-octulosonic-acid transferase